MLTIPSILALLILLLIASAAFFVAKRVRLPYTVFLVLIGLLLVPVIELPVFGGVLDFLQNIVLTPELLFYVFLPVLIFESAFNMNLRKMVENAWHITLLSVVGLLISAVLVAAGVFFFFELIGLTIPFIVALLFGAIISSTDPVAVLALFREFGAPKRLTLIFEGESLFNDGTAVALFLVLLGIATDGFYGGETVIEGIGVFVMMAVLGIVFGLLMATLFSKALRYTKSNEFVSITVLIVSAHLVFVLSELINKTPIFGLHLHISPIIATTVSSLFLGTYARHILSPASDTYLQKSIEHLAFLANSLVFLLAGILFASTNMNIGELWQPVLISILVVMVARAVSVYAVTIPLNIFRPVSKLPSSWQLLLAWGSLRGALAIIVVLLIPDNFMVDDWQYAYTPKELLLSLTIGCILTTLFFKAPTIGKLITRLGVNKPSPLQEAHLADLGIYYLLTETDRIVQLQARGYIDQEHYDSLHASLSKKTTEAHALRDQLRAEHGDVLFVQSLHHMAIAIEGKYLKELYMLTEVNEAVYRRIKGKLNLQQEKIEYAQHESIDPSSYMDRKDVFDRLVAFTQNAFSRGNSGTSRENSYQYYRAQAIIARKVSKVLRHMQSQYGSSVFYDDVFEKVAAIYDGHRTKAAVKADQLAADYPDELAGIITELSMKSLHATGDKAIRFLGSKGMVDETIAELLEHRYAVGAFHGHSY